MLIQNDADRIHCSDIAIEHTFRNSNPIELILFLYGSAAGDTLLPPNDDSASSAIVLPTPFLFFGANYSTVFVSLLTSSAYMAMYIKDAFSFYCAH